MDQGLTVDCFRKACRALENANTYTTSCIIDNLGYIPIVKEEEKKPPRKEHKMDFLPYNDCYEREETDIGPSFIEAKQRQYLLDRLTEIQDEKATDLKIKFGLNDMRLPNTPQELVDRIKNGLYILPEKVEYWQNPLNVISWRDPNVKKDQDGFDAAEKILNTSYDQTKDAIVLGTLAEGKSAMETFRSWTLPTN